MMSQDGKTVDILLVEDNPGDAELAREALAEAKVKNNIYWSKTVKRRLLSCGRKASMPTPRVQT